MRMWWRLVRTMDGAQWTASSPGVTSARNSSGRVCSVWQRSGTGSLCLARSRMSGSRTSSSARDLDRSPPQTSSPPSKSSCKPTTFWAVYIFSVLSNKMLQKWKMLSILLEVRHTHSICSLIYYLHEILLLASQLGSCCTG